VGGIVDAVDEADGVANEHFLVAVRERDVKVDLEVESELLGNLLVLLTSLLKLLLGLILVACKFFLVGVQSLL